MEKTLPAIPAKRYFTIGEVADLCGVKPHVLRYWEQEFSQLRPMKRRGNRRYYQHHEVLMIRRIRDLLYDQGFTISGARNQLLELAQAQRNKPSTAPEEPAGEASNDTQVPEPYLEAGPTAACQAPAHAAGPGALVSLDSLRRELVEIRALLLPPF
jgi:DNA-binding transcriptional MerR regulator